MVILGIDPGTATTGYGVIKKKPQGLQAIDWGCIKTDNRSSTAQRLQLIEKQLSKLMKKYQPQKVAVEDIFFFKNTKTAIKVSQARGIILSGAAQRDISVDEYTPLQVKQAVTGYGRADKNQIQKMVKVLLSLKEVPKPDDAADALAVAICCAHSNKNF